MSFGTSWKSKQYNIQTLRIEGYIGLTSAAAIDSANTLLNAATVAKTGTGEYTVTLNRKYTALYNCQLTFESDTDVDITLQVDAIDVAGTSAAKTVVIKTMVGAVPTDVTNASRIFFYLAVRSL